MQSADGLCSPVILLVHADSLPLQTKVEVRQDRSMFIMQTSWMLRDMSQRYADTDHA